MRRLLLCFFIPFGILMLSIGCSDEQDFGQFDDLSVTPTLASSIFYLESDEQFINSVSAIPTFYSQIFNFDAFNEQFVAERLLDGTITYEIENTTSKRVNLIVEFLDEAGNTLDVELFEIEPTPSPIISRIVAYGPGGKNLDILTTTSNLRVTGNNLSDATSTSSEADPKVIMRSAAEFRFRLK